jgi:DNA-binding NtrC family response regulator
MHSPEPPPVGRLCLPLPNPVTVVAATRDDSFHVYFQEVLAETPATVVRACSNDEVLKAVQRDRVTAVLFDQDTQGGHWRALLRDFAEIDRAPALIVSSRLADERLWAEVLNLGGFDLLLTPFQRDEVTRVVDAAIRATQRGVRAAAAGRKVTGPDRLFSTTGPNCFR